MAKTRTKTSIKAAKKTMGAKTSARKPAKVPSRMANSAVAQTFESYPPSLRTKLKTLRALILDVAATTPDVGAIDETLKWGSRVT